ncbi:TonB-dependent receptor [Lysobacter sp. KIS68-7]|uniref:TonB-dependent receptor family protein n=1 Tax=Lysobacter sp. KIS68-7 TaxID=2904252 RepID=UPI001E3430C2|nr:TonB-dependent receptor [Lysobacter sp. KIS68-7]UHQ18779.1 TonB-dependent receptor [Lysobacter sp. KIS68-7]
MFFPISVLRAATPCRLAMLSLCAIVPAQAFAQEANPQPTTLDTVEVVGINDIQAEQALTPGAVSVVDGNTFYQRSVTNMADSLRYVPGVWSESATGGDDTFISSRGSNLDATDYDGNGIRLFQDGMPVTTADGNNHNREMDPMAARYAVVARGNNALTYGASTLGGAIDYLTPTARNTDARQVFLSGGSDGAINGRITGGGVMGDFDGLLTMEGASRDGYREHSQTDRFGVYANAGWQPSGNLDLRVYGMYVNNHQELAGTLTRAQFEADPSQANPSAITGNFQLNVKTERVAAKGTWTDDGNQRLEFGLSYEDQDLYHPIVDKVLVDFDGPGPAPPVEVFSLLVDTHQRTLAGMLRYSAKLGDHDVLAGLNYADTHDKGGNFRNDGGRRNGQTGIVDNRSDSVEVFLVDRWKFAQDWTLVYGGQGVFTSRDVSTIDVETGVDSHPKGDFSSFNPRLGAIYALSPTNELFASLGRLYEAPTNFELTDEVRGNNTLLDAMHGNVVEVGMRGGTAAGADVPRWHWDLSVYYAQIHDEILSVDDPFAPGTSLSKNIDSTTHAGIEALVGASFPFAGGAHRIEPLVSVTYNDFSFDHDPVYGNNDLPAAPDYAVRGEVMYRNDDGFFAGPTFDVIGSRWGDFSNTYRIGSYSLMGLRVGVECEHWDVFAELRNVFDKDYVSTISVRDVADADAAILQPGAPRSVYVGVRLRF